MVTLARKTITVVHSGISVLERISLRLCRAPFRTAADFIFLESKPILSPLSRSNQHVVRKLAETRPRASNNRPVAPLLLLFAHPADANGAARVRAAKHRATETFARVSVALALPFLACCTGRLFLAPFPHTVPSGRKDEVPVSPNPHRGCSHTPSLFIIRGTHTGIKPLPSACIVINYLFMYWHHCNPLTSI